MSDPKAPIAYEQPDDQRAATAAPTEPQIQAERSERDAYAAFRVRDFQFYAVGFFLAVVGSNVQIVAAQYEVYQKTHQALSLGWIGLALAIPMLIFALPAGQAADTFSRRKIVMTMQLVSALCAILLASLFYFGEQLPHSIAIMYVLLAMTNVGATFGRPARAALLPQLVGEEIFTNAVTWNSTTFEMASVLGPAIGGVVCAHNIGTAYLLAAICFCLSFFFMKMLPDLRVQGAKTQRPGFSDFIGGLKFVFRVRLMLATMTLDLFAVLLGGAVFLLPAFADDILHVGPIGFGWLRAAPSVGAISMAIVQAHRAPFKCAGRTLLLSVLGFGAATIVFGLSRNFWLSLAMLALTGAFDNISVVIRHTLIQLLTPDAMRGRVSAVNQIFIGSSNELGGLESGLSAAWLGVARSVIYGGIGTIIVVIASTGIWPDLLKLKSLEDVKPVEIPDNPATA